MSQRVFPRTNKPLTSEYAHCGLPPGDVEGPPRPWPPVLPNPSCQLQTETTIVDVLIPDCWRLILDHLNARDVVRSERVSRGWRGIVHCYLQGIKKYNIKVHKSGDSFRTINYFGNIEKFRKTYDKYWTLHLIGTKEYDMNLNAVLRKVGPSATHLAVDCVHEGDFERVVQNCPRLEHLEIYTNDIPPLELAANCKALRSVTFCMVCRESPMLDDNYLGRLVANESMEELALVHVSRVTGRFLRNLRSPHLKTLEIRLCKRLKLIEIYLAVEHLKGLTKLELNDVSDYSEAYLLLERMPNLEYLSLGAPQSEDRGSVVDKRLNDAISRLGRLQYLNLHSNRHASDALLEALARGCKDLRALDVGMCPGVSGRAVAELCAARAPTLREVFMSLNYNVRREDVLAIIQCYHDIQDLNPSWLTEEIPGRVKTDRLYVLWSGSAYHSYWNRNYE